MSTNTSRRSMTILSSRKAAPVTEKAYETILVERDGRVGTITLNQPEALNALNTQKMNEVTGAAIEFDADPGIGAIVITGSAKAFAAGGGIKKRDSLAGSGGVGGAFLAPR